MIDFDRLRARLRFLPGLPFEERLAPLDEEGSSSSSELRTRLEMTLWLNRTHEYFR